ncbi:DUF4913 domain-containing protein, partial [Streptomyces sp. NPDC006307]|uniref:DUF4913 domain-containing protein n=1 Tax=Streptomyces sp. NPDC006307 TaxID=3156748 RepID=UPI0033A3358E
TDDAARAEWARTACLLPMVRSHGVRTVNSWRLAYQQHKDPEAGLSGLFVWHRDFLTHAIAAIRAPGGPLSACMTSPERPAHRILPGPPPSARTEKAVASAAEAAGPPEPDEPTS